MNNKLAIVIAVILGVIAALAVRSYVESEKKLQEAQFQSTSIAVANKVIKPGDEIKLTFGENGMVAYKAFPERMIRYGMLTPAQIRGVRGFISKERIEIGQPLFRQDLQPPVERVDTSTQAVEEGLRAVTIPVDMVSGIAGLIRTGDRVDVIVTFDLSRGQVTAYAAAAGAGAAANAAGVDAGVKTLYLLQNIRVIALDNKTAASVREGRASERLYRAVTLEVSPEDALRLINAQEQGRIRLMLRHRADVNLQPEEKNGKPIVVDVFKYELGSGFAPHTAPNNNPRPPR